eukprot:CAMPEP_0175045644 /NCGR_PEP_ID=MMETSP0052_2-20121109/4551_1 /TAXON_ID=51329 ORGANISM="Polytomella parva, Strain SAG 63-3" /NCGR_SAMPLE_ID=MMETSP0052_2 /ASSEMBLY_ACC=CAM_ASM_000194 /LENGTH=37 /DNA_ID= /DNA_START= /DNA_END= /DNA_ORIENTATION=
MTEGEMDGENEEISGRNKKKKQWMEAKDNNIIASNNL